MSSKKIAKNIKDNTHTISNTRYVAFVLLKYTDIPKGNWAKIARVP